MRNHLFSTIDSGTDTAMLLLLLPIVVDGGISPVSVVLLFVSTLTSNRTLLPKGCKSEEAGTPLLVVGRVSTAMAPWVLSSCWGLLLVASSSMSTSGIALLNDDDKHEVVLLLLVWPLMIVASSLFLVNNTNVRGTRRSKGLTLKKVAPKPNLSSLRTLR